MNSRSLISWYDRCVDNSGRSRNSAAVSDEAPTGDVPFLARLSCSRPASDGGHELRDHGDVGARGGQRREYRRVDRSDPVQRSRKSTQQDHGIVVSPVTGQPGHA